MFERVLRQWRMTDKHDTRDALMPDDAMLSLDRQLCFAIYSAAHAFNRTYKPLLDPYGLTYPQYLVLLSLWQDECEGMCGV